MPNPRVEFGAIYFNGNIYLVGGWQNYFIKDCEIYNIASDSWIKFSPLNEEREDVSLCIVEN